MVWKGYLGNFPHRQENYQELHTSSAFYCLLGLPQRLSLCTITITLLHDPFLWAPHFNNIHIFAQFETKISITSGRTNCLQREDKQYILSHLKSLQYGRSLSEITNHQHLRWIMHQLLEERIQVSNCYDIEHYKWIMNHFIQFTTE